MKNKLSILTFLFVTIFLFSAPSANAYPNMYVEKSGIWVGSGDNGDGTYSPYIGNGNEYSVTVTFDLYCLDANNKPKFIRSYSVPLKPKSGTVNLTRTPLRVPSGCFWVYPTNVRVN